MTLDKLRKAALSAVSVFVVTGPPSHASFTTPQKSLRALGGRQVWVPLCSRRGVNGSSAWFDAASTAVMDQEACISPSWGTVTAVKLVYAAFDMPQQGEVDRPVIATGQASVFVPSANVIQVFGGASVPAGSAQLNPFQSVALGVNGISLGQSVASAGGGVAPGAYVMSIVNNFNAGAGNTPSNTLVGLSAPTSAATANGQPFTFSGAISPVKFGGKKGFTIEPNHDVVTSDPVAVTLSPNTWFMVRTAAAFSAAGMQTMDTPVTARITVTGPAGSIVEFSNRSLSFNDQTSNPQSLSNTGGGYWGPVAVLAQITPSGGQLAPGAVLVLGDSIAAGTGDVPDNLGFEGYIQRSLENSVPFVTAARGSTTAFGLAARGDGQYALSVDTGITDILLEAGRNDIEQFGLNAGQLVGSINTIAARYVSAGKRVWCFTIPPTTYSNDAWTSQNNQAFPVSVNTTSSAATPAGSFVLHMVSVANVAIGQLASLNGSSTSPAQAIAPGSVVVGVNAANATVTLSVATAAALAPSSAVYFGSEQASASPLEVQREIYNNYARANWSAGSATCAGLIDVDAIMGDQGGSGKWRSDLGQASADGVHPSAAVHQAVVNAGLLNASRFIAQ